MAKLVRIVNASRLQCAALKTRLAIERKRRVRPAGSALA